MRSTLVVTEIALACVLLVGAGLLLRSFLRVLDVDLGFEPSRAAAISVDYDDGGNAAKRAAIWQEVVSRASMIPGVEAAGISDNLPMSRNRSWGIAAKGEQKPKDRDFIPVFVYIVSPGYLKAMGMRLMEGRDISWDDLVNNRNVVIINETVARRLWPGQNPIGRIAIAGGAESRGDRRDCRCSRKQCGRQCRSADVPAGDETVRAGRRVSGGAFEAASRRAGHKCDENAAARSIPDNRRRSSSPFRGWWTTPRRRDASLSCSSESLPAWVFFWLRWEFTALSHIPSRGRRRRSAYAWLLAPRKPACSST